MAIHTAIRIHTGKKPANLQVLSELIYPKTQLFVMTNIFPLDLWWLLRRCCPNVPILQTWLFRMKNSCPLFWWWHVLKFFTDMRAHTGEKPEQLQVFLECSHPKNIGHKENLILMILIVICAYILHCHENTYWWEACQTTGVGRGYSLTKHGCDDKINSTVLLVVCNLFYQYHVDTYWWETYTAMAALRVYLSNQPTCM